LLLLLRGSIPRPRTNSRVQRPPPLASCCFLHSAAKEAELLSLAGLNAVSHLKVGDPDRFHNVIKIAARAPADPPLPPLVCSRHQPVFAIARLTTTVQVIAHGYGSGLGMW
jgi:hypothetical protein